MNEFANSEIIRIDDLANTTDWKEINTRIYSLLSGKIESLRNTGTEEEFAEFERRLMLASIDELWMTHIDGMAHLREEVAFEGYAQKNPLVIYKERAYDKFIELVQTMGHRVIKGLLTARAQESLDSVNLEETLLSKYAENAEATFDIGATNDASHMGHTEYEPTPSEE